MTAFRWFFLDVSAVVVATSPFTIAKAIRRGERYRIVEILIPVSVMVWLAVQILQPAFMLSVPLFVRRYPLVAAFGMLAVSYRKDFRLWYYRLKETIVERRSLRL